MGRPRTKHRRKALVIFSGGQDSTTCLFWAKQKFDVVALTFNYGQRHAAEINAAKKIAELAGVRHEVVDVPGILKSCSPLTDPANALETYSSYEEMDKIIGDRVELTFVPMRNAFFLTLAANRAIHQGIFDLVTGVCEMDNANYPDCRANFISHQAKTINMALGRTAQKFKIHTPLIKLSKKETVLLSKQLTGCWEALAYSHTCYAGQVPPCGKCHSCILRSFGFKEAGEKDPLVERFKGV